MSRTRSNLTLTSIGVTVILLSPLLAWAGHNDYFQSLAVQSETIFNRSYQTQNQIDADTNLNNPNTTVLYDASEDAAKFTIGQDKTSLGLHVRPHFSHTISGNLLYVWDARWGAEFADSAVLHDLHTHKAFQLAMSGGGDNRRLELRTIFRHQDPASVARVDLRRYYVGADGPQQGVPGQLNEFLIKPETWTRYWAYIDLDNGTFSWWMADEGRTPVVIFRDLPMNFDVSATVNSGNGYDSFWWEYNSSQNRTGPPLHGWFRNMVVMRNISNVDSLVSKGAVVEPTGVVSPPVNRPPIAYAGKNFSIPLNQRRKLGGKATDDELPSPNSLTYLWEMISGPGDYPFTNPTALNSKVSFDQEGVYILRLTAEDGVFTRIDDISVSVGPQAAPPPPPPVDDGNNNTGTNPDPPADPGLGNSSSDPFQNLLNSSGGGTVFIPCQSQVRIFQGTQEVRVLECGSNGLAEWDGRNNEGELVSAGVYLVWENGAEVRKVVVLQ